MACCCIPCITSHEIRKVDEFRTDLSLVKEKELALATSLMEALAGEFEPEKYQRYYRENLLQMIEAKKQGQEVVATPEPQQAKVVDILEALKASLAMAKKAGRVGHHRGACRGRDRETRAQSRPRLTMTGPAPGLATGRLQQLLRIHRPRGSFLVLEETYTRPGPWELRATRGKSPRDLRRNSLSFASGRTRMFAVITLRHFELSDSAWHSATPRFSSCSYTSSVSQVAFRNSNAQGMSLRQLSRNASSSGMSLSNSAGAGTTLALTAVWRAADRSLEKIFA